MSTSSTASLINGIDTSALWDAVRAITDDPAKGATKWKVTSHWRGGTRSDAAVSEYHIGGQRIAKDFTIKIDEPSELCGTNQFANPQEYLLAALNACMIVGYAAACSVQGIKLDELRIETEGDIDLRGFLGIDPGVKPGYDSLRYTSTSATTARPSNSSKSTTWSRRPRRTDSTSAPASRCTRSWSSDKPAQAA